MPFYRSPAGVSNFSDAIDLEGALAAKADTPPVWQTFTSTLTGWSIGDGTASGAYVQVGSIVHYRLVITVGSTTTFGDLVYTYPVTAAVTINGQHMAQIRDASPTTFYLAAWRYINSTTGGVRYIGTNGIQTAITSTAPITFASGDNVIISGTYEAAV